MDRLGSATRLLFTALTVTIILGALPAEAIAGERQASVANASSQQDCTFWSLGPLWGYEEVIYFECTDGSYGWLW